MRNPINVRAGVKMIVALLGANDRIVALLNRRRLCRASKRKYQPPTKSTICSFSPKRPPLRDRVIVLLFREGGSSSRRDRKLDLGNTLRTCSMVNSVTFAIGDVHGCFGKLKSLIAACDLLSEAEDARFVFIGDYVDRGPDSRKVIDFLIQSQHREAGRFICLRGNHETMLINASCRNRS
jgi:hypothetical protein